MSFSKVKWRHDPFPTPEVLLAIQIPLLLFIFKSKITQVQNPGLFFGRGVRERSTEGRSFRLTCRNSRCGASVPAEPRLKRRTA